jgi:hypothetical protein
VPERRGGVLGAAVVACGLLVLEDPATIAVRHRLAPHRASVMVDVSIALVMVAYNYGASRYVVGVSSAADVTAALAELDAADARAVAGSAARRVLRRANPFLLVRGAGGRVGALATRAAAAAHRRRRTRLATTLVDLAAVNVLGVPGVGLERAARGRTVGRLDSLRHAALFVLSWFAGARVAETLIVTTSSWPVVGGVVRVLSRVIGGAFTIATDVSRPIGAVLAVGIFAVVTRLAWRVDRLARSIAVEPATCIG